MRSATSHLRAATAAILLVVALAQPARGATSAALPSDFNGDGYADLAIGAVGEAIGGASAAGSVNVLYGSSNGLRAAGDQSWSQASPGVKGTSARDDRFGTALASADFDRDGYADLAIGVLRDRVGVNKGRNGAVNVLYGSRQGLTEDGDQRWTEASVGIAPDGGDLFGAALAARDFDGDGYADLAIGIPNEDVAGDANSGLVVVLRGGATGLVAGGAAVLSRSMTGASSNDHTHFGGSFAAGDLNGDGFGDLVVGAVSSGKGGSVGVFYGSPSGLDGDGSQLWSPDSPGIGGEMDPSDGFGRALTSGDFDADGIDDVAATAMNWAIDDAFGVVTIIYGSSAGLTAEGNQQWDKDDPGVAGDLRWGSLAAADFDGDGDDDLAVGIPELGLGGAIVTLDGSPSGLTGAGSRRWSQDTGGAPGAAEPVDQFGAAVAAADYGRSGHADLAIGVPGEDVGGIKVAGSVNVLYGSDSGLSGSGAQAWGQGTPGVAGTAERADTFGQSLVKD